VAGPPHLASWTSRETRLSISSLLGGLTDWYEYD
jgi:hypothetical protein